MFHERLAQLRGRTGLSQKEIAKRLGMARTTYAGYENGSREPDLKTLEKLSDFFEVDLNWLISGSEKVVDLEDEKIIENFNKLSIKGQDYILELMEKMIEQEK